MGHSHGFGVEREGTVILLEDTERRLTRQSRRGPGGEVESVLVVQLLGERPSPAAIGRLAQEHALSELIDRAWALRPVELTQERGRHLMSFEDPGGVPLEGLLKGPIEAQTFLRFAIGMAAALAGVHSREVVHKDIKPANFLVNCRDGRVRLTGFGIASRLLRERQSPGPPEFIAGTLAYMAPEQTGRMNRSIDARSDLYSLGATFYVMLTGHLPFSATDAMEWVHCHIARQPLPPATKLKSVPAALSNIVMKLLSKNAEDRYQTAEGLELDLQRCLAQLDSAAGGSDFPLGEFDAPRRLLIPEKLYGREQEVKVLLDSFDRVVQSGNAAMVLVSGYAGIGKSSVVNELHGVLVAPRGWFASGKADQYKRAIPYSTLAQAFHGLVRSLLGKSAADLSRWRRALLDALEPYGRLITDLVPDLELIIGEQPAVPALDPPQAKGRFHNCFRRFIGVFATSDHPLALFLDDLQWSDEATLDLLEDILIQPDVGHLLVVGAFRDNEVDAAHPLTRKIEEIRAFGTRVHQITLGSLGPEYVRQLTTDALRPTSHDVGRLARLVHAKTAGNPFFVLQFLQMLADEGLLLQGPGLRGWSWDLERIHAKGHADNVAGLIAERLTRLPEQTLAALKVFACLGNVADLKTLSAVLGSPQGDVHAVLWEAVRLEMVTRQAGEYRFTHDKVLEAVYSAIAKDQQAQMHLRIGRLLAQELSSESRSDSIFDVANHLNRGASLLDSMPERASLANLNLLAGRRAKEATAHTSALAYFAAGSSLVSDASGELRDLTFELEFNRAESEFLTGLTSDAERRLAVLAPRAGDVVERAHVACLQMDIYINEDRLEEAVNVGLSFLRSMGSGLPAQPSEADALLEFGRVSRRLEEGNPVNLPLMSDPLALATLNVLVKIMAAAHYTDPHLTSLTVCRAVGLCLDQGNSDASCIAYLFLSSIAGRFGRFEAARRFGDIGYDLVELRGLRRFQARAYVDFASLAWMRHARECRDIARRAVDVGNHNGDIIYATHACWVVATNRIAAGDLLSDVQREAEAGLAVARKTRFGFVVGIMTAQLGLVRSLRGLTPKFGSFDAERRVDLGVDATFSANRGSARVECWYSIRQLQARFFAGEYGEALAASSRARPLLWSSPSNFEAAEYHFYSALCLAAAVPRGGLASSLEAIAEHHRQLVAWASSCPENFGDRATLVSAELARLKGADREAMDLYERAIDLAGQGGFVHNEAIGNELAARFYVALGLPKVARTYLRDARYGYLRWGADGKVRQLDALHPELWIERAPFSPTRTIGAPIDHLDLATVIKVSQTVSSEIVLDRLIDVVMRAAMEHAGAQRSLLVLARGPGYRIEAEAIADSDAVTVNLRQVDLEVDDLPASVFHYAVRMRENVVLRNAREDPQFGEDEYIRKRCSRSVLCLPLINQARLVGALYLENGLSTDVFTPSRTSMLTLLASGAATSLENGRLYRDLQEREARVRRLFNANIIGIFTWSLDGRILDANEALLSIVGYDNAELQAGHMRWKNLMPAEWDKDDDRRMSELLSTGIAQPFEAEYVRKDGARVPVLIGAALFEGLPNEGVAFVLDLSDRKRAEDAARESSQRYNEVQMRLRDANRLASVAELSASIAHELNQPLSGILTNAGTCLRMLSAEIPNIMGASETMRRTIRDADRAAQVVARLRALFANRPTSIGWVDLNAAAREAISLTSDVLQVNRISTKVELAPDLPRVAGDRVQLQQVILNLVRNAMDAMSSIDDNPRQLSVRTEQEADDRVRLSVTDTGEGLDPGKMDKLFEAFYTSKRDGMGIGLFVSRSIVESHRGRLWASPNDGAGATFTFSIPRGREDAISTAGA